MDFHLGNSSISSDATPPDRSSSNSAPPALQLASESLFAFRVEYAKIFSDIRAHEDYYNFYETYGKGHNLPPPLEAVPFLFESSFQNIRESHDDLYDPRRNYQEAYNQTQFPQNDDLVHEAQRHLQDMQLGMGVPRTHNVEIPTQQKSHVRLGQTQWSNLATPLARKAPVHLDGYPSDDRMQDPSPVIGSRFSMENLYSSSPSAQTVLNTTNFIWKDEEQPGPSHYGTKPLSVTQMYQSNGTAENYGNIPNQFENNNNGPFRSGPPTPSTNNTNANSVTSPQQEGDIRKSASSNDLTNASTNGEQPADAAGKSNVVCRYYQAGYCSRGDKCYYSHDVEAVPQTKGKDKNRTPAKNAKSPRNTPTKNTPTHNNNNNKDTTNSTPSNNSTTTATASTPSTTSTSNGNGGLLSPRGSSPSHSAPQSPPTPAHNSSSTPSTPQNSSTTNNSSTNLALQTPPTFTESDYNDFPSLAGKIYFVSKDQQGCRFLQKKLEEQDAEVTQSIFSEVFDYINELMTDPFGNYLCQKLLEHCNDEQRLLIVEKVADDLVVVSKNMHGTRAVQKLVECLSSPAQIEITKRALKNHVVELIQDLNGNHVIQRCLNRLSPEDNQFIYDAVTTGTNCIEVATHRHGCCVLQRCIDHASPSQKVQLINEITHNALVLVQDPYGNYVVQYVLELPFPNLVELLAKSFAGHLRQLATQKFSSNVVEKVLAVANLPTRTMMIAEILTDNNLIHMLQDPFANYVVQTALTVSDAKQHYQLVEAIKPHLNQLRNTPYGKRIQSKILKESGERQNGKKII